MLYRSNTLRVLCPVSFIATRSGTLERTRFRTAVAEESPEVARRVVAKLKERLAPRTSSTPDTHRPRPVGTHQHATYPSTVPVSAAKQVHLDSRTWWLPAIGAGHAQPGLRLLPRGRPHPPPGALAPRRER